MLNDMAWRKTPRDLLTNPKIRTIANRVDPSLRQAVFAFYVACYMEANDDGVLDLQDTEVFADLIMVDDENIIADLTLQFIRRGFMTALNDECTLIYLEDWDNPNMATVKNGKRIAETQEARRARVTQELTGGKKKRKRPAAQGAQEPNEAPDDSDNLFFSGLNDKNEEIVATTGQCCDKIQENVATIYRERDKREIEPEREIKETHTHTEESAAESLAQIAIDESREESTDLYDVMQTNSTEPEDNTKAEEDTEPEDTAEQTAQSLKVELNKAESQWSPEDTKKAAQEMGIPDSAANRMRGLSTMENWRAAAVFYKFFDQKGAFKLSDSDAQYDALVILTLQVANIAEPKNPAYVIAGQLCKLFENLVTNTGPFNSKQYQYFLGMPLTPFMLLKPSTFPRVLTQAKKTLSPGKTAGEFWENTLKSYAEDVEKDKSSYNSNGFINVECQKMGIDPTAPDAYIRYCQILSRNRN